MRLLDHMARRGYMFILLVGTKLVASDPDRIRIGTTADILSNKNLIGPLARLLRDVADILESGDEGRIKEWLTMPKEN